MHPNKGDHQVIGTNAINPITTGKFNYGQHQYGHKFLVHKDDVYMPGKRGEQVVLRDPARFVPIQDTRVEAPKEKEKKLEEPEPLIDLDEYNGEKFDEEVEKIREGLTSPDEMIQTTIEEYEQHKDFDLQTLPGVNVSIAEQLEAQNVKTKDDLLEFGVEGLITIKGIAEKRAKLIIKALEG
jgi:hypothetical protein